MDAGLASVQDKCQCFSFTKQAVVGKSEPSAYGYCGKCHRLRLEHSLHGRQNWVEPKGLVFKHILANCFAVPRVCPEAECSRRCVPSLGVGNRVVDGDVEQHRLVVHAPETLDEVQLVAVGMAHP